FSTPRAAYSTQPLFGVKPFFHELFHLSMKCSEEAFHARVSCRWRPSLSTCSSSFAARCAVSMEAHYREQNYLRKPFFKENSHFLVIYGLSTN
ncbi:hypothetical protein L2725_21990, partial [Shewanella corallii]